MVEIGREVVRPSSCIAQCAGSLRVEDGVPHLSSESSVDSLDRLSTIDGALSLASVNMPVAARRQDATRVAQTVKRCIVRFIRCQSIGA